MDTYLHPESRLSSKVSSQYETLKDFHLERLPKEYREQASLTEQDAKGFTRDGLSTQSRMWTAVMAEYSGRDLSVLDDRYPALAVITEEQCTIYPSFRPFLSASVSQSWVGSCSMTCRLFAGVSPADPPFHLRLS